MKLGKYRHFKGKEYEVIGIAKHSEDPNQEFVVYRALYESKEFGKNQIWIRPKKMFLENIERDDYKGPRFKYIEEK